MDLTPAELDLLAALEDGLPLVSRPFGVLAERLGTSEAAVIGSLGRLIEGGAISRLGVIVHHRELGYGANAMVVWEVPDERAREAGRRLAALPFVALSYRRPRRLPVWPYNLFAMIFGRDRHAVGQWIDEATAAAGLEGLPRAVLFGGRRFKQRGARYRAAAAAGDRSEGWTPSTAA